MNGKLTAVSQRTLIIDNRETALPLKQKKSVTVRSNNNCLAPEHSFV